MRRVARGGRSAASRGNEVAHDIFNWENLRQLMMLATVMVVGIALVLPRFAPELLRGADCYERPNIVGGNQQSVLAANDDDQALSLEVYIANSLDSNKYVIPQNTPLEVIVVFRNNGGSPISLYLDEDRIAINRTEISQGLAIRINPETAPQDFLAEGNRQLESPPGNIYDFDDVYVIEGHRSCHINIILDSARLQSALIAPGRDYELKAIYNNTTSGTLPIGENPTATPMFDTLGVWDEGTIESEDITFFINP